MVHNMGIELEIKLLEINPIAIRKKLITEGAHLLFDGLIKNTIFYGVSENDHEYVRVRDNNKKITITYKDVHPDGISTTEHEIVTNSYDNAVTLLTSIGLTLKRKDEKRYVKQFSMV